MQLKDYVSECLTQIVQGVQEAQEKVGAITKGSDAMISPGIKAGGEHQKSIATVEFDIATTVEESTENKAGAGIIVFGIGLGGQHAAETRQNAVSRVRFSVPVKLPKHS